MKEHFSEIDLFFAQRALPNADEEQFLFLATLMALSRLGHLALQIENNQIKPDLSCLGIEELSAKVIKGAETLPEGVPFILRKGNHWYLKRNGQFEKKFIEHLLRLSLATPRFQLLCNQIPEGLEEEQRVALQRAFEQGISFISGGPGTGKSYVASCIVEEFLKIAPQDCRVVLTAPTGKAAAHLAMKVGKDERVKSGTLHMLLNVKGSATLNQPRGYLGADLIIVDECSMIDVRLFSYLLASVESGTRMVFMGDENQLPPVDAGSLFADLLDAIREGGQFAWTHLTKCMRSDRREILDLAENILKASSENLQIEPLSKEDLCSYFPAPSAEKPETIEPPTFCILSCMRQGPFGVDALNQEIVSNFLARARRGDYLVAPIIVTKNDYRHNLFNGQMGTLLRQIGNEEEDQVVFTERTLPLALVTHYEYAYVLSVHKSQGSEYDQLLLIVPPGSELFGREVLYTAVTRARKSIQIRGCAKTYFTALSRSSRKNSGLGIAFS